MQDIQHGNQLETIKILNRYTLSNFQNGGGSVHAQNQLVVQTNGAFLLSEVPRLEAGFGIPADNLQPLSDGHAP